MKLLRVTLVAALAACGDNQFTSNEGEAEAEAESEGEACEPGETRCAAGAFQDCGPEGAWGEGEACGGACDPELGCVDCLPGTAACNGNDIIECGGDGAWGGAAATCDPAAGDACANGACVNACDAAAASNSYIGCEYWPTVTVNAQLGALGGTFDFAVAVGNPQGVDVTVTVTRGASTVTTTTVPAGQVATIALPWVDELRGAGGSPFGGGGGGPQSIMLAGGAYRLSATMPVTAYQFNPLQFESTGGGGVLGTSNSYTNDASILLPTSGLEGRNMVVSRPTWSAQGQALSGFMSVVGTEDGTAVTLTFSAYTRPSATVGTFAPGDTATFALDAGDVLQILSSTTAAWAECGSNGQSESCIGTPEYDLTGTLVEADAPVAVFGGHDCTFVPYNKWACDHLEEQIFPLETWGSDLIVVSTEPQVANEPNVWKVVSGSDGNAITFEPAAYDDVTLDAGQYVEFEYQGAFRVIGTGRVAVAQFMVGEDYNGLMSPPTVGDPAMGLGVPYEQFRTSYDFLTPETYTTSYVNVTAPVGAELSLDGAIVPSPSEIGSTGYGFVRVEIPPGAHHIESPIDAQPFGITVSGLASYTSYLYPGGLDLELLPID